MEPFFLATGILLALSFTIYISLILIYTFGWYRLFSGKPDNGPACAPLVSLVVAARNEEDKITGLLADLTSQDYPSDRLEVLIVDDLSTDQTADVVRRFLVDHTELNFKLISITGYTDGGSKKRALATGITSAAGDIILTTDADCRVGPGWVSVMAGCFNDHETELVAGPVSYLGVSGLFNDFQALEFLGMMAAGAGGVRAGLPFICNGANLAYRRALFMEVRGFEGNDQHASGDDVFFLHKVKQLKGSRSIRFAHIKEAIVHTYPVKGIPAFFHQRIRWASKSRGYRDVMAALTAATVFLLSLSQGAVFFAGFFNPVSFLVFLGTVVLKSLIDLPLMLGVTGFTTTRKSMRGYLLFQTIYPFYVAVAGMMSLRKRRRW